MALVMQGKYEERLYFQRVLVMNLIGASFLFCSFLVSSTCVAQEYEFETYLTLQQIVDDLNNGGYTDLANKFAARGFHPDGIKAGVPCTPTAGKLYVSSLATGSVLEIDKDGTVHPYVNPKKGAAYGNSFDSNGNLFVSRIVRFKRAGGIDVVLAGSSIPADGQTCYAVPDTKTTVNDLVVTKDGKNIFFSDDTGGRIFKCDVAIGGGGASCDCQLWLKNRYTASFLNVFGGVDGLILDNNEQTLYFNNFLKGRLYRVAINPDGSAGIPQVVTQNPLYGLTDGMSRGGPDGTTVYTATFKLSGGSAIAETDMESGQSKILIEDHSYKFINPAAALTADNSGPHKTLYISAMDMPGYLLGYKTARSDGGHITKVTLTDMPGETPDISTCEQPL